ncbi:MAG: AIPR family protein [Rhodospirillales bacterium]
MTEHLLSITTRAHHIATKGCILMDRITSAFLTEFSDLHDLTAMPENERFEHFAAYATVRRHYNGETFNTEDIHTGGGGDMGIDATAILVNGSIVSDVEALEDIDDLSGHFDATFVFIQADRGTSFEGKKISDFGFGVKDFFDPEPRLQRNEKISLAAEVMDHIYKKGSKFRPGNPVCRLYYVTTGIWTSEGDLEVRRQAVEADLKGMQIFRDVEFICLGAEQLQEFYRNTKNAVVREFSFSSKTLLPDIVGVNEAYIGFVSLGEFMNLVQDDSGDILGSIFLENVRDWQEYRTPVNDEIKETVSSDHTDRFVVMNNGITMIARNLTSLRGNQYRIEDYQIVNGCQTTNVLFDQRGETGGEINVPFRLIVTEDQDVIKSIIRGTNRQTKVEDDQFFALTDFAEQLEDYFDTFPEEHRVYYERRSGQYNRRNIHNTRIVPHRSLVKLVASIFAEIPHQATRRYSSLREIVGRDIFAKGHKLEPYYVSAYSAYKLDVGFRSGRIDSKLKAARFHILLAMRSLANPASMPQRNAREMEAYCKVIMNTLWDGAKSDNLCTEAGALIEAVADASFSRNEEGGFHRDDIRTQGFTEGVIAKCKEVTNG